MKDERKTKRRLIEELEALRRELRDRAASHALSGEKANETGGFIWMEQAVNATREGIVICDGGREGYPVVYANRGFEEITGYSREEVLGRNMNFLQGPGTDRNIVRRLRNCLGEGSGFQGDVLNYRKNGEPFWSLLSISPVRDESGDFRGYIAVISDVTEFKKSEDELRTSRRYLRKLVANLEHAREEERKRIARELHDELGQRLAVIAIDIALAGKKMKKNDPQNALDLESAEKMMAEAIRVVNGLTTSLRPPLLDELGLESAMLRQAGDFEKRTGIMCRFDADLGDRDIPETPANTIYRIFQEALTNVSRHSGASNVSSTLRITDNLLELVVADNGRGIGKDDTAKEGAFGLLGMRERVDYLRGSLSIEGDPSFGTRIRVCLPLHGPPRV